MSVRDEEILSGINRSEVRSGMVIKEVDSSGKYEAMTEYAEAVRNRFTFGISGGSEEETEAAKRKLEAKIMRKLESGKKLTTKELNFLRKNNPALYAKAMRVKIKREALEHRLENAKSKEEVMDIYGEAMASISKDDSAKKYLVAAVTDAVKEFKETRYYKNLPNTKEEADAKKHKSVNNNDMWEKSEENSESVIYETKLGSYQQAYTML